MSGELFRITPMSDGRAARVARLREEVARGAYRVPAETVAEAMLRQAGSARQCSSWHGRDADAHCGMELMETLDEVPQIVSRQERLDELSRLIADGSYHVPALDIAHAILFGRPKWGKWVPRPGDLRRATS